MNRLAQEKSPYLLQHAENPVDWYPWGEEAFETARKSNKPVFLSIGYSTCHWCHVMEHESFSDQGVAELMNQAFVSIKVDREERPDLDDHFMNVSRLLTGTGGWPLTIVMTPQRKPFYAATYIPRENAYGRMGMLELIPRISDLWQNRREDVDESAEAIAADLGKLDGPGSSGFAAGPGVAADAARALSGLYDATNGGFGSAPKFPMPTIFGLLLRAWKRDGNSRALEMVTRTLSAMRSGGIYDQVGFGFHRYSTDAHWRVPHFEKMLYDQALHCLAYTEAWQATGAEAWKETAREICAYVLRDLALPEGAFATAEDADSEGVEGRFYAWTAPEVRAVLGRPGRGLPGPVPGGRRHPVPRSHGRGSRGRGRSAPARGTRRARQAAAGRQDTGGLERFDDRRACESGARTPRAGFCGRGGGRGAVRHPPHAGR